MSALGSRLPRPNGDRIRVLWVTNLAAPYRIPVWRHLMRSVTLRVALLEPDDAIGRRGVENRTADWAASANQDIPVAELHLATIRFGSRALRILLPGRRRGVLRGADAVLLGGWEEPVYWQLLVLAKLARVRVVGFYESTLATNRSARGPIAWARRRFFRMLDGTVVPGVAAADALEMFGVPRDRITVGFNAVDVSAFHAGANAHRAGPVAGHRFVYVGQLIARKRVDSVIRAFSTIATPDDRLTLLGEGEREDALRALADDLAPGRIDFHAPISNSALPAFLGTQHTLVLASDEEVWGLVVNEALAAGLHVVVSENCGVAPSVASMRGARIVREDLLDLAATMRASRASWNGADPAPEILSRTPEAFADVFLAELAPLSTDGATVDRLREGC